ncbi:MAG: ELWxxDGT repeat protein [Ginsengibacter sp.]
MKHSNKIVSVLILICVSTISALQAQNFNLIDINDSKDGNPVNNYVFDFQYYDGSYAKYEYAVLNGISFFAADDGIHGAELWRSDATGAGTQMVKDIYPGAASSAVHDITVSGGKIFFSANDGIDGQEIWVSDGTDAGTFMLKDLSPFGSSSPSYLIDANGTLYFFSNNISTADQLWKSDGTASGTVLVADFYSPDFSYSSGANRLTNVNGRLFFGLNGNTGAELWTSDGTSVGTIEVKDINPFGGSDPASLTALNGLLYFSADDGTGRRLWVSDGTFAGTNPVNNANNIYLDYNGIINFTTKDNSLYLTGYSSDGDGSEFCSYNASNPANNIEVIKDINPGTPSRNLYNITNVNGTLFFTVYNGADQVLWKSDGTTSGTMQVKDINPGGRNIYLYKAFENANGTLLFSFYDDDHGYEIWKSDGTEAGTVVVKEIYPGVYSSWAANITYVGSNISLFQATDGKSGIELWKTDGTEAGTTLVKNINKSGSGSSLLNWLTASADKSKLLFTADEHKYGAELRISDGSESGTHVVKDIFKGSFGSNPYAVFTFNNKNATYFIASVLDTSDHTTSDIRTINKLCKTDSTGTTTKIFTLPALQSVINGNAYVYSMEATSGLLYLLILNNSTNQYELWRTDETAAGTYAVKTDILPYYNVYLKGVGNTLFFTGYDFNYGNELWKSDGSIAGTRLVKDIYPGPGYSNPSNLTSYNGKLYFSADYGYGPFIWTSDGTEAGTITVKPLLLTYSSFAQANGKLFFYAVKTVGKGSELFATDGTPQANIRLVKDINKGPASSNIYNLISGDTTVYFIADDGKHGFELWKSNGTNEGTQLVKDITPGINSTYTLNAMVNVHDKLFFTMNDTLWQSDGTKKGTHSVSDANLSGISGLSNLTAFGNKLAFVAFAPATGRELYTGNTAGDAAFATSRETDIFAVKSNTPAFNIALYPNPSHAKVTLEITGNPVDVSVTIADLSGRIVWQKKYNNQSRMELPTEKLTAGMYLVTVKSANENKTIKLVKEY